MKPWRVFYTDHDGSARVLEFSLREAAAKWYAELKELGYKGVTIQYISRYQR